MSRIDHIKEVIGLLKLALGALIAVDVSLIAWLAQHYATADSLLVWTGVAATLIIAVGAAVGQPTYLPAYPAVGGALINGMGSYNGACSSSHCYRLSDLAILGGR